jgi:hypothetical protein
MRALTGSHWDSGLELGLSGRTASVLEARCQILNLAVCTASYLCTRIFETWHTSDWLDSGSPIGMIYAGGDRSAIEDDLDMWEEHSWLVSPSSETYYARLQGCSCAGLHKYTGYTGEWEITMCAACRCVLWTARPPKTWLQNFWRFRSPAHMAADEFVFGAELIAHSRVRFNPLSCVLYRRQG